MVTRTRLQLKARVYLQSLESQTLKAAKAPEAPKAMVYLRLKAPKGPKVMGQAAQVLVRRMMMTKTPSQAMDRPRIPQWQVTVGPRWI